MGGGDDRSMKPVVAATALAWLAVLGRPPEVAGHTTSTGLATLTVSGSTLSYRLTVLPGELPAEPTKLRALPGVGAYTAGAVASFAFERRAALVDTNVARVLRRVFAPRANFKPSTLSSPRILRLRNGGQAGEVPTLGPKSASALIRESMYRNLS